MGETVSRINWALAFFLFTMLPCVAGCSTEPPVSTARLVEHRMGADARGLGKVEVSKATKITCAPPAGWEAMPLQSGAFYSHQQWRSPTRRTATGSVYIHMPLPFSAKTLAWMVGREYAKKADDGKMNKQWTDALGREWFDASNAKYHVKGYVMTRGFDAWINYSGYRTTETMLPGEVELSQKSLETILPLSAGIVENATPTTPTTQPAAVADRR